MKKVLSLVLALVMVLGMTTVGLAADPTQISEYSSSDVSKSNMLKVIFTEDGGSTWDDELVLEYDMEYGVGGIACTDDDVAIRYFDAWMYNSTNVYGTIAVKMTTKDTAATGTDYTSSNNNQYKVVTEQQAKKWDLGLNMTNSSTFEKVEIKYENARNNGSEVILQFLVQDYLVGTSKKKSEDSITAKADGKNVSSSKAKITSYLKNGEEKVEDKDDETADLSGDKKILKPTVSISKLEIDLSEDAVLYTRVFNDKKIYAHVVDEVTELTMAVCDKYGFARSYRFLQTGVTKDASTIQFDESGTWVYAIDDSSSYDPVADSVKLIYVGKGDAKLPIYEYYFFSLKEVTLETEAPADEPPIESDGTGDGYVPSGDQGPSGAIANANYNPGTGR